MEKFSEVTKKYVENLFHTLETTNDENVLSEIAEDLKFDLKFKVLMEELVSYALKNGKSINSFLVLKSVSRDSKQRMHPEFLQQVTPEEVPGKECEKLTEGVTLFKGTLVKMLEKMELTKSKEQLVKSIVLSDEENGPRDMYTESEIENFDPDDFEVILKEELNEKYSGQPIIISSE